MLYTAVEPCRLLDTRVASPRGGRLPAQAERSFLVYDADFLAEQGGAEGGCDLPDSVRAVAINLTAVDAAGRGFVTVWDFGKTRPATANINLIPGEDVNNQLSVAVNTDPAEEDLTIYSWASTHLVADIVGYYTQAEAKALDCVNLVSENVSISPGIVRNTFSPTCPAGYAKTGGGCTNFSSDLRLITTETAFDGNRHFCASLNVGTSNGNMRAEALCCRVPGG